MPTLSTGKAPSGIRGAYAAFLQDIDAAIERDPATESRVEMALTSPGLHAIWVHRAAHRMWGRGGRWRLPARLVSQAVSTATGVEIHPGATIGKRFFIDHGMGVVIGETAQVGDDVMLYNGVNLGGRTMSAIKRHPTLGDGVTVGAGARILGPVRVGPQAQIGANAVVTKDVPASAIATGVPARVRFPQTGEDAYGFWIDPAIHI